ncbi:MAG: Stp1/IreP family PP2C-type Ser/Thr phosphatase [Clostridia bacterium]|jgi:protein phosphatase|nr:Stp1/IreP family PP2C-type Ser/Thr phosphatase [Clostridia bacterium]
MRKFKLKGTVAQKLMEFEQADAREKGARPAGEPASESVCPEAKPDCSGLKVSWRTDTGKIRKSNQDAVILADGLFGIADGMGGHNGGETASRGLRDGLVRELQGKPASMQGLEEAVRKVNLELWEQQEADASLTGMGTTLTAIWMAERDMLIAQVGDSRAYLLRNGEMKQMTEDHSMVADMVRRGILTEDQAACHPMRNYITRAIGTEDTIEIDGYTVRRQQGDRWLICSDGLYGQMPKTVLNTLSAIEDPEEAADALLNEALTNGGRDNISLILIDDLNETAPETEADEDRREDAE